MPSSPTFLPTLHVVGAPTPGWHASWGGAQHACPGSTPLSGPGGMAALPVPGAKKARAAAEKPRAPQRKKSFFVPTTTLAARYRSPCCRIQRTDPCSCSQGVLLIHRIRQALEVSNVKVPVILYLTLHLTLHLCRSVNGLCLLSIQVRPFFFSLLALVVVPLSHNFFSQGAKFALPRLQKHCSHITGLAVAWFTRVHHDRPQRRRR